MRYAALTLCGILLAACNTGEDLRLRHGSPLYRFTCAGGKTFQTRQILSGEVEVTAGGQTRDATNATGDPIPGGPHLTPGFENVRLTGMAGGPYETCSLDTGEDG